MSEGVAPGRPEWVGHPPAALTTLIGRDGESAEVDDRIVLPAMSEQLARQVPNARTAFYPGVGHSPFRESTERFNADLHAFATSLV